MANADDKPAMRSKNYCSLPFISYRLSGQLPRLDIEVNESCTIGSRYLNPDTQCLPLQSKKEKKKKTLSLSANAKTDMNLIAPHYVFLASRFDLYYMLYVRALSKH
jgi:hypothetical protein